jgi:hypothetical protein
VYRYRGLVVRFPGAALVEPDGRADLELTGIVPDYPVGVTVEDLLAGRDPDLAKALTVLEAALDPSAAPPTSASPGQDAAQEGRPRPLRKE